MSSRCSSSRRRPRRGPNARSDWPTTTTHRRCCPDECACALRASHALHSAGANLQRLNPGELRLSRDTPVNLFWTGGWDSTFRLLQLLLEHRLPVAPVYLIDDTRASTQFEFDTMDAIRDALFDAYPRAHALLRPTQVS